MPTSLFVGNIDPALHRDVKQVAFLAKLTMKQTLSAIMASALGQENPHVKEVKKAVRVWQRARAAAES